MLERRTANSFVEKTAMDEVMDAALGEKPLQWRRIGRVALMAGMVYTGILLAVFSMIIVVRLAYGF